MKNIKGRNKLARKLKLMFTILENLFSLGGIFILSSSISYFLGEMVYDFDHTNRISIWPWYGLISVGYLALMILFLLVFLFLGLKALANKYG